MTATLSISNANSPKTTQPALELPTLALTIVVYGGWIGVTLAYRQAPFWLVAVIGSALVTLHSSLQHEILHGHPTRWRRVNRFFASIPLSLWMPYERYRQTHLMHHVDERLTDPLDDPESYYWTSEDWARLPPALRLVVRLHTTLAGRVVIGPFWSIAAFWRAEFRRVRRNQGKSRRIWRAHLLASAPVVIWLTIICGMPLWLYCLAMVLPGTGILLIRSFAEHRARPNARERTAIVEGSWILGPLFLFNNLHSAHHEAPTMPWYEINAWYRANRERLIRENGGLVYFTYFEVARRYLFWPHDAPRHPTGRAPHPSAAV